MKKLCCMLCLLVCLGLLSGCSGNVEDGGVRESEPTTTAPTETTVPETSAPETTAPTEPEPSLPQTAVTEYPRINSEGYISMVPITDTKTAVVLCEYDQEYNETRKLCVLDLATGETSEPEVMGEGTYLSVQAIDGDMLLMEDLNQGCYILCDDALQPLRTISVPVLYGYFTPDLRSYYYVDGDTLMVYDPAFETTSEVEWAVQLHLSFINGYDSEANVLLAALYTSPYSYETVHVALDLENQQILMLSELTGVANVAGDGVMVQEFDYDNGYTDIYYYAYGSEAYRYVSGDRFSQGDCYVSSVPDTNYLLLNCFGEEDGEYSTDLMRLGATLTVSKELSQALPGRLETAIALHDGSLLCSYLGEEGFYSLALVRPEQFAFEPVANVRDSELPVLDLQLRERYDAVLKGEPLPSALAEVRALADEIEEEFGITILLSSQCAEPAAYCDFSIVTTDRVEWMDEAWYIRDALYILRRSLELYPEGFFEQFRWEQSVNGILVLLVEDIQSDNNAIGVSYYMHNWYPIAVDITSYDLMSTYCHELWHATENFISDHDYNIFNDGAWEEMNPDGFWYSYDTTLDYIYETEWTYFDGWYYNSSYFVDSYARTNAKEDRARLMEYIMAYEEETRSMMEAPALYEKTGFLCNAIRQVFDTTGWENVWWERYHGNQALKNGS